MFPKLVLGIPICFPVHLINIGYGKNSGSLLKYARPEKMGEGRWGGALLSSDEHVRSFEMIAVTDWSALSVLS